MNNYNVKHGMDCACIIRFYPNIWCVNIRKTYVHAHIPVHTFLQTYMHTHTHSHTYTHTYIHSFIHTYIHTDALILSDMALLNGV